MFSTGAQVCYFDYATKSFVIKLEGSTVIQKDNFVVQIHGIKNPVNSRTWAWSVELEKYSKKYAFSNTKTISLDDAKTIQTIPNIEIGMSLANTGELSTYTFKVPRLDGLNEGITDFYVEFPLTQYDEQLGKDIKCNVGG